MKIWQSDITLADLDARGKNTMIDYLGITFTEIGDNFLVARMPARQTPVADESEQFEPVWVRPRDALARHGLSIRQVAETIEVAFSGMAVSRVQQGQATYDLAVRFDPAGALSGE